jgi:hypothetical protein
MSTLPDDDSSYTDDDWYRETQNTVCLPQDQELLTMYRERQAKLLKRAPSIIDTWNWHIKTRADIEKYTLLYEIGPLDTYPTIGVVPNNPPLSRNSTLMWVNPASAISVNLGFIGNKQVFLYEWDSTGVTVRPVYTFDQNLTAKDMRLLDRLYQLKRGVNTNNIASKFESVIRLIPGSYQNGAWQQLDGFFGMYYNNETNELSVLPPAL